MTPAFLDCSPITPPHGGPAAALSRSGRVLAATPSAWTSGRIDLSSLDSAAVIEPLGEGILIRPDGRGRSNRAHRTSGRLTLLGGKRAEFRSALRSHRLSARHGEIAALLALHPDGLTSRELAAHLFGELGHETAVRAELHRLRTILGDGLAARPYRLTRVESDLGEVRTRLDAGDHQAAARAYGGELLPQSQVAAIAAERDRLAAALG